jgi:hypothetical protein
VQRLVYRGLCCAVLQVGSAFKGKLLSRDTLLVCVTATPHRSDGESLVPFCDVTTQPLSLAWGILQGWLCDIEVNAVRSSAVLSGL